MERRREVMTRYADWLNDERGKVVTFPTGETVEVFQHNLSVAPKKPRAPHCPRRAAPQPARCTGFRLDELGQSMEHWDTAATFRRAARLRRADGFAFRLTQRQPLHRGIPVASSSPDRRIYFSASATRWLMSPHRSTSRV